jgi:hypothetical protein
MKKTILSLAFALTSCVVLAQYDGNVGTSGCRAISINSSSVVSWAKGVEVKRGYQTGTTDFVTYGKPYMAQGKPDSTTTKAVSLGEGGSCIVTFDRPIINGNGDDFMVVENAFGPSFLELGFVEVSSDGVHYFRFPSVSNSTANDIQATYIYDLAGKYEVGWGTPFDLDELPNDSLLNKWDVRYVKIVDVKRGVDKDSQGNIIYDGVCSGFSSGFDLTGVGVINAGEPYITADFENMLSSNNTYEITTSTTPNVTTDASGDYHKVYTDNGISFQGLGLYGGSFSIGWGLSNLSDTSSSTNSYASACLRGVEGENTTYLTAYYSDYAGTQEHCTIAKTDSSIFFPKGIYVNNSKATFDYILSGRASSSWTDTSWFKITATGYDNNNNITGTSEKYLADYRQDSNGEVLGAINEWSYMDLTALGQCKKIKFTLTSTDANEYGLLVPAYFCVDRFMYSNSAPTPSSINNVTDNNINIKMYPNPTTSTSTLTINGNSGTSIVNIFDIQGRMIKTMQVAPNTNQTIDLNNRQGTFFVRITTNNQTITKKLIIQ